MSKSLRINQEQKQNIKQEIDSLFNNNVIEFQHRGLTHVHFIFTVPKNDSDQRKVVDYRKILKRRFLKEQLHREIAFIRQRNVLHSLVCQVTQTPKTPRNQKHQQNSKQRPNRRKRNYRKFQHSKFV